MAQTVVAGGDTSSGTNHEGIWDALKFAFLGAYAFIVTLRVFLPS